MVVGYNQYPLHAFQCLNMYLVAIQKSQVSNSLPTFSAIIMFSLNWEKFKTAVVRSCRNVVFAVLYFQQKNTIIEYHFSCIEKLYEVWNEALVTNTAQLESLSYMTAFACSPNDRREVQLKTLQAFDMGSRPTYGYMPSTEMY